MSAVNAWNAKLYDDKFTYVSHYGKGVVELLEPKQGERILDLGCGTGDLSNEISKSGAIVTGMDASVEMINKAREKYSSILFMHDNGETFRTDEKYHAVFSNAALHWMKNAEQVVHSVEQALIPGGRFVAEFGGKGNVQTIIHGIEEVLKEEYGVDTDTRNPWYFPSIGEYSTLLEQNGFEVTFAHHFNRPTLLPDGEYGLYRFLDSFAKGFFPESLLEDKRIIYEKIKDQIQSKLFKEGIWEADYRRIRVIAIKQGQ